MYSKLVGGAIFPLQEFIKRHNTIAVFRDMERTQWLSEHDIASLQLIRLKSFLSHIGEHVPYYRKKFLELGFLPERVQSLADIQGLPITGKPEIRTHNTEMKSELAKSLSRFSTSGSSGHPLTFYLGRERVSHDVAAKRRATRWWGVDIGDVEVVVWGSPVELGSQNKVRIWRDQLFRSHLLSSHNLSPEKLTEFAAVISRVKPKMLFGYPSALAQIAEHAESMSQDMAGIGIKVVFVTAEQMTEQQRRIIECVFGCPTANGYGGRDAGFIAHQCPEGGMHITAEDILVEILDEEGNALPYGEVGEIVVTHFASTDFPFLRYPTGDLGALSTNSCTCGRGLPLLREISGRCNDFIVGKDGRLIHQTAVNHIMRDMCGVREFKLIQHNLQKLNLKLVTSPQFEVSNERKIRETYCEALGHEVEIEFDYCKEIAPEPSGKRRYVVSHVGRVAV